MWHSDNFVVYGVLDVDHLVWGGINVLKVLLVFSVACLLWAVFLVICFVT
jgi:hypothetical protein